MVQGVAPGATRPAAGRRSAILVAALAAVASVLPVANAIVDARPSIGDAPAYALATLAVLLLVVATGACVPRIDDDGRRAVWPAVAAGAAGIALIAWLSRSWFDLILHIPIDPYRADMLVVIQQGLHRLMLGRDPYALYHVPWEAPLPYGIVLWAPFLIPELFRADLRLVTLVGALVLPAIMTAASVALARRRQPFAAAAALAVAVAWLASPALAGFVTIGHTPAYWPLLPLFAWLVAEERWTAAAGVLGLLIVGRTTMVAIAPVFAMAIWQRDRRHLARDVAAVAVPLVVLFVPFALWNWSTFEYGLYGSYQRVMKGFVWASTNWAQQTIGLTGFLLRAHLSRLVEGSQVIALAITYALAWRALRRGADPGGWMAVALCVFSMTTLWPVMYIYFDVIILLASAVVFASTAVRRSVTPGRMLALLVAASVVVPLVLWIAAPADAAIDVGTPPARRLLVRGFSTDEREGARTFAWIDGREAELLVPRFSRAAATLAIVTAPAAVAGAPPQQVSVIVNGVPVGTRALAAGWHEMDLPVPARALTAGLNRVQLYFQSAVSPREAGTGDDPRRLSAAIDSVRLYSSARLVPSS